jgi:hypothetical protein
MSILEEYKVDHLFLLVGTNPLPNYVAAQLLVRDKTQSQIWLVHSAGVAHVKKTLTKELTVLDFKQPISIEVKEARPEDIRNQIDKYAKGLSGVVGLHYTGGTKAMAVHAYLAMEALTRHDPHNPNRPVLRQVFYSYLDARTLSMVIEGTTLAAPVPLPIHLSVTIEQVLALHGLHTLKRQLVRTTVWPFVSKALARIYTNADDVKCWREWCRKYLRHSNKSGAFVDDIELGKVTTATFPFDALREAFQQEYPDAVFPLSFADLAARSSFGDANENMAKWFDGVWFEHFVFQSFTPLLGAKNGLTDLAMTINPLTNPEDTTSDFELDVVGMRGHQMFALTVTSSEHHKSCKQKLLEALVRTEQLGGSEACVALVCCTDQPKPLHKQVSELFHQEHLKVFGRSDLPDLQKRLADWIK